MISAVINTLNEERNIAECIKSLRDFADQIVVCDMHSTDQTVEIAYSQGAKVVHADAKFGDFGRLRQQAILQATGDWVLVIDADERLTPHLAERLSQVVHQDQIEVVYLSNLYWYFGDWIYHGAFFANTWPRFFRRETYIDRISGFDENIHNDLSSLRQVSNRLVLPKQYYLKHYAYPTIEKYVHKTVGIYARLEAEQYHKQGRKFSIAHLLGVPLKTFISSFFLRQGFRDGTRGLILNILFACYRFTIWANLWLIEELEREQLTESEPEPSL